MFSSFFSFVSKIFTSGENKQMFKNIKSPNKSKSSTMISHDLPIFSSLVKFKSARFIWFKSFHSRCSIMKLRWPVALHLVCTQQVDHELEFTVQFNTTNLSPSSWSLHTLLSYFHISQNRTHIKIKQLMKPNSLFISGIETNIFKGKKWFLPTK